MPFRSKFSGIAAAATMFGLCASAQASGSNALDRLDFGNTASESSHSFNPGASTLPPTGIGALGLTYRQPYGANSSALTSQSELVFNLNCDSVKQNYLTVKLWGDDRQKEWLMLQGQTLSGAIDSNGGPPAFPGRFHYETVPIPIALTQGKTSVQLTLYPGNADMSKPARPIYSVFSHTDPYFIPDTNDVTGAKPSQTGPLTPTALTSNQVFLTLQTNRQNLYGNGGYYSQVLARQVMSGTAGAPTETIGLDLWTSVSGFNGASKTADQWRDQIGGGEHGPGYSTVPDELLSVLVSTYLLPPFTDANGHTVAGLDHYHDASVIQRIVSALDGVTYLQSSDGGLNHNGNGGSNVWQGLTSTARAAGHAYAGSTARGTGWGLSLEGVDTQALGFTIIRLLNDSMGNSAFQTYLNQNYDADLNGGSMKRAYAYERLLSNQINYLKNVTGGTESQNMFEELGLYAAQIALEKLQALYPNSSYPTLAPSTAFGIVKQVMGLNADTLRGVDPGTSGFTNYGLTAAGFGEAHGRLSCGYDGRYGTILPWLAPRFAQLASLDPGLTSADQTAITQIKTLANATINGYDRFVSACENVTYPNGVASNAFTLAQEDFITYRDPYNPNANGNSFEVDAQYLASDPGGLFQNAYAQRSAYLEVLYGVTPRTGAGGTTSLNYLKDLAAYESTLRSLINVNPSSLIALPGEPGQSNSAFVDAQSGATAVYYNGERFYLNANWRNYEVSGNQFGVVSNLARIHDTVGTIDRAALVYMPHDSTTIQSDGNLSGAQNQGWVARFGPYLIAGNNSASAISVKLPTGTGSATELVANHTYAMGSTVSLAAGAGAVFILPGLGAGSSTNGTANLLPDGGYTLSNRNSGLLVDDKNNSLSAGNPIDQWTGNGGFGQIWYLKNLGNNDVRLINAYSNLVLEVLSGSMTQGGTIDQWTLDSGSNKIWHVTDRGSGYYSLAAKNSGLVLEVPANSLTAGTVLDQWPWNGGNNQQWKFIATGLIPNGTYTLTNGFSGLVFDANGPSGYIAQNPASGGTNQQWTVTNYGNSIISLKSVSNGKSAQILYGTSTPGAQLATYSYGGGLNEVWQVTPVGGGNFSFTAQNSGLVAEDPNNSTTANTILDQNIWAGTSNQWWLVKTAP